MLSFSARTKGNGPPDAKLSTPKLTKALSSNHCSQLSSPKCKTNCVTELAQTMTWDKESRMLTNSLANASYVYNGFDARVSKTVSSTTTTFKRAGADPVSPVVSDVVGGSTTTNYLPGISSRTGGTSTFSHSGIKNGVLQTNSSQTNTATKRYDAFGNELSTSGTWQTRFDYGGGFGYQRDDESGYKLLGHRYYDPEIGRFLTRDPIKDGRNWYAYCENDPVSGVDPTGELVVLVILGVVGGLWAINEIEERVESATKVNNARILVQAELKSQEIQNAWVNNELDWKGLQRYNLDPMGRDDAVTKLAKLRKHTIETAAAVGAAAWEVNSAFGGYEPGGGSISGKLPDRAVPSYEVPFFNGRLPADELPVGPRDVGRTWR